MRVFVNTAWSRSRDMDLDSEIPTEEYAFRLWEIRSVACNTVCNKATDFSELDANG